MPFVSLGLPNHDTIPGVSANDHHTATVAADINLNDLAEKLHASLAAPGSDDHHAQGHTARHNIGGADSLATAEHFALVALFE